MNYSRVYFCLIERSRKREVPSPHERHHITPRCIGGSNDDANIAMLTPEEHYLAHQLLIKIFPNEQKLIFAAMMMTISSGKLVARNNKVYGWLKKKFIENHPSKSPGFYDKIRNHPNVLAKNKKNSDRMKGEDNPSKKSGFAEKLTSNKNWQDSHPRAIEAAKKASLGNDWWKLKKMTDEGRKKLSQRKDLPVLAAYAAAIRAKRPLCAVKFI